MNMELPKLPPNSSLTYAYLLKKYGLVISWDDAAKELGIYWETLRRLCAQGEIPIEKVGRSWLLTTKALANYIDYGPASKWGNAEETEDKVFPQKPKQKSKQKRGFFKYVKPKPEIGDDAV